MHAAAPPFGLPMTGAGGGHPRPFLKIIPHYTRPPPCFLAFFTGHSLSVLPPSFRCLSACPCAVPPSSFRRPSAAFLPALAPSPPWSFRRPSAVLPLSLRRPSAVLPPPFCLSLRRPSAVPPPSFRRPSTVLPPVLPSSFRRPFAVFPLSLLRPGHLVHKVFCQSGVMFRTHEIFQLFLRQMGRDAAVRQRQLL